MTDPNSSSDQVTPKSLFMRRREWIKAFGLAASLPVTATAYRLMNPVDDGTPTQPPLPNLVDSQHGYDERKRQGFLVNDGQTSRYDATHLNNFLEFTSEQENVWSVAKDFQPTEWTLQIGGLVERPITLSLDEIESQFSVEERIYRMRCVEGWSMVIPWAGFPLARLLELARPTSGATFVAFTSLLNQSVFPNQIPGEIQWPYREGLRMDEAMHPLAILATGMYRERLPPQNGAPLRLVVPWKYGFKSIKSVVKIELVDQQPTTAWHQAASHENGFYANVNPDVDHPRWSQATERRVGEFFRRPTLPFNGYGDQVASLYRGMDLTVDF